VTGLRILATSDLGAATLPLRTSTGDSGTCAGVVSLLEREQERGPAVWLDVGDLVVGHPSYPLLGERPWADVAGLPNRSRLAGPRRRGPAVGRRCARGPGRGDRLTGRSAAPASAG
jgi:hypothetical protein